MKKVQAISSVIIDGVQLVDGYEYEYIATYYDYHGGALCMFYRIKDGDKVVDVPCNYVTISPYNDDQLRRKSRIQYHYEKMTEDAVVKDGDYVKAVKELLGVDMDDFGVQVDGKKLRMLYESTGTKGEDIYSQG